MKNAIALAFAGLAFAAGAQTLPPPPGVHQPKSDTSRADKPAAQSPAAQPKSADSDIAKQEVAQRAEAKRVSKLEEGLMKRPAAQVLPGVGLLPGEQQLLRPQVVSSRAGRTETVYLSSTMPNRIATPFDAPRLIDAKDVEYEVVGQSIYLLPTNPDKVIGVYITGSNPTDEVVSLTIVPKLIPQQTVTVQLDGAGARGAAGDEPAPAVDDPYSERIRYVMRQVAMNKVPEGFAEGALPKAVAALPGATLSPISRYSGSAFDVYRYQLTGTSEQPVELSEEAFYTDGVRAVAFFPTAVLQKGERTTVFVIADKTATGK